MKACCDMRGFLSFLVLRIINTDPKSGKEISDELERRKGHRPSPGTIYPVLKQLREGELIKEIDTEGREKTYELTLHGRQELERATKQFVRMFCCMKGEF